MKWTVVRDLCRGRVEVTLKNEGYCGFSVTAKCNGSVERKVFNDARLAKQYALDTYGARF